MLDTLEHIETPEGVSLSVRPAGPYSRILARLVDFLIELIAGIALIILYVNLGKAFLGLFFIAGFILMWLYNVLFEVYGKGATPGKRVLGLHVVYTNGAPVSLSGSILRNFLRVVDVLPTLYALGVSIIFGNSRFQRLGDMAAGTVVAYRHGLSHQVVQPVGNDSAPLRLALSSTEHKAIAQFVERNATLSNERCEELADLLAPITGLHGDDAINALRAHANWLSGSA
ncbi:MAG: RDD family protein [Gammaproteobacteria bacterium]